MGFDFDSIDDINKTNPSVVRLAIVYLTWMVKFSRENQLIRFGISSLLNDWGYLAEQINGSLEIRFSISAATVLFEHVDFVGANSSGNDVWWGWWMDKRVSEFRIVRILFNPILGLSESKSIGVTEKPNFGYHKKKIVRKKDNPNYG